MLLSSAKLPNPSTLAFGTLTPELNDIDVHVIAPVIFALAAVRAPAAVTLNGEFVPSAIPSVPK